MSETMAYFLDLFSPETHTAFSESDRAVSGFRARHNTTTLRTIENIDVLWLKGRSMARAFEVEHTTAIYSGILRMADLLALQPNMDIRLHIVAPEARKQRGFDVIRRPVFSLLEGKPLAERCTGSFVKNTACDAGTRCACTSISPTFVPVTP